MAKPLHVYLISAARKTWRWSNERREAIRKATKGNSVECAKCSVLVPKNSLRGKRRDYTVDHILPIVRPGENSPKLPHEPECISWDLYLERMMFGRLQILCHPCHKEKTRTENAARKKHKARNRK